MLKCPGCGAIVQEAETCGICGASLLEARSETLEDLLKEEPRKAQDEADVHWKRRKLFPSLVLLGLSLGLILLGFVLLLYTQPATGLTPFLAGLVLLILGVLVLLNVVSRAGYERRGWYGPPRRSNTGSVGL